jgi:zinc D-Ala-D-Ala carboxypeptidase
MYKLLIALLLFACAPKSEVVKKETASHPTVTPLVDGAFDANYLMGKFDPAIHPDFVRIAPKYTTIPSAYLRNDAYEAFKKMYADAEKAGIRLTIISATRNFAAQKNIWEKKWTGKMMANGANLAKTIADPTQRALKILDYSSMPGTSRHHWGTDMDFVNLTNPYFEKGKGVKIYEWLLKNAHLYGFCQPYTAMNAARPTGYHEEKWHWSYQPISQKLTAIYPKTVQDDQIVGFLGAETAKNIAVIKNYVQGINQSCKQ